MAFAYASFDGDDAYYVVQSVLADNISRVTVWKAVNDKPGIAPDTKRSILQKAVEMGYPISIADSKNINVVTAPPKASSPSIKNCKEEEAEPDGESEPKEENKPEGESEPEEETEPEGETDPEESKAEEPTEW